MSTYTKVTSAATIGLLATFQNVYFYKMSNYVSKPWHELSRKWDQRKTKEKKYNKVV